MQKFINLLKSIAKFNFISYNIIKFYAICTKGWVMERELLRALNTVKDKTGIKIQVVSENGVYYASTIDEFISVNQDLFSSSNEVGEMDGFTYFKFTFGGNKFIGVIEGVGEEKRNYASLIIGYIEMSQSKNTQLSYDEELSLILTGNSTKSRTLHFMNKYATPKTPAYVSYIKCPENRAIEVQEFARSFYGDSVGVVTLSSDGVLIVKHVEVDEFSEVSSPTENAHTFKRSIFEELGINVVIYVGGIVKSFIDVAVSYNQALSTEKMSEIFGMASGVLAYKDVILAKILEDNSPSKISDYFSSLLSDGESELLNDNELMFTGDAFLSNNLNVSETAREMFIHRNTLIYRLDKIQRLTGLDIRKFSDALNFRILFILSKLKG